MDRTQTRKITRKREMRACIQCRRRKLKCDNQRPCASCTKREDRSCTYEQTQNDLQSEHDRRHRAEARLEHLEKLVRELSQAQNSSSTDLPDVSSVIFKRAGEGVTQRGTVYSGATHCIAMLEDIEEIRDVLYEQNDVADGFNVNGQDQDDGIGILFGAARPLSLDQVISSFLPSRPEADRLVAAYFRTTALTAPFIHTSHFRRLYQKFWEDSSSIPCLWMSMLFSILDISERSLTLTSGFGTHRDIPPSRFAAAAAHCLVIACYYRPQPFAVEALLLFAQARCLMVFDISPNLAVVFGTLARLTTVMGYHREADNAPNALNAFEREIRRRTWSLFMQLDLLVSFQLGLPCNIQHLSSDTKLPSNILDSDFDEDSVQIPLARPVTEITGLVFYIAKHKLMSVFEKILRRTLAVIDQPIDDLDALDQELSSIYASLPTTLQAHMITNSVVDSPAVVVTRLCVTLIYHKSRCVLHRQHIARGREASIQACYDSATALVGQFADIYPAFEPGGQLETQRWFMASISWHDFLLGCTVLCLCICSTETPKAMLASAKIIDILKLLQLLKTARTICETRSSRSRVTSEVQELIDVVIAKFDGESDLNVPGNPLSSRDNSSSDDNMEFRQTGHIDLEAIDFLSTNTGTNVTGDDPSWEVFARFLNFPSEQFPSDGSWT